MVIPTKPFANHASHVCGSICVTQTPAWGSFVRGMNQPPDKPLPGADEDKAEGADTSGKGPTPGSGPQGVAGAAPPAKSKMLTQEEQMALYEKDLQENDWGHQPC